MTTSHSPFYLIKQLIFLEREDIVTLIAYGLGIGVMSLATPVAVQTLVNTVAFGALFQPLVVLSLVLFVLVGFSNTLSGLQFYVMDMLQRRLFVRLLGETATRLQKAHIESSEHHHLPELVNRFLDVVNLNKAATTILLETLGYVLQTVIGMLLLAFYHPLLLAFDFFLIISLGFILFGLGKNGIETAIAQSKAKYEVLAWLENIAANLVISKSSAAHSFLDAKTEQVAQNYLTKCAKHFSVLSRQNTSGLVLHTLANTLLLGMGGWMVLERQLSLGQLIAAELIVTNMMYGLTRLGKTLSSFYALIVSGDKLSHLLDIPQESGQGMMVKPTNLPYQVDVHGIVLPESPNLDVIQGLDMHLRAGDKLVISGGADRGSVLDVLYGLRLPVSGYVRLNDHDLRDLNLRLLRDTVCLVRDAEIIDASVLDNLRLSREIELSVLWDVLEKVGLHDAVAGLSGGLNHSLSPNGAPLTTEQCLRLTLARAIVAMPRLLLLDGTLDRIDQRVLPELLDYLFADNAPWTLIVTSHHPLVIARASCHVQLRNGILVEA
jgi:putative ABC transport system ATP-binding protein